MKRSLQYLIAQGDALQTVGDFLRKKGYSHHLLALLKRSPSGLVLNSLPVPAGKILNSGDCLLVTLPEEEPSQNITPAFVDFSVVYEDEDLLVINKPADTPIHPSINNREHTLANGVLWYYQQKNLPLVFRCISRLDRDTSGLLVVAKNMLSASILTSVMKQHTLAFNAQTSLSLGSASHQTSIPPTWEENFLPKLPGKPILRTYLAIVEGRVPRPGIVNAPIARREGSVLERCVDFEKGEPALTHYAPVAFRPDLNLTLLSLRLETGRTHQIRVHMKHLGHPIIGDFLYHPDRRHISRQALHSWQLSFSHPITGKPLQFQAPLPEDMAALFPHLP